MCEGKSVTVGWSSKFIMKGLVLAAVFAVATASVVNDGSSFDSVVIGKESLGKYLFIHFQDTFYK